MRKVYVLPPNENWICDRFAQEWNEDNSDITVPSPALADVVWLMSSWCWMGLARAGLLSNKRVLTTIHHIVPEKFDANERRDFDMRDTLTTVYHVPNMRTKTFIQSLTSKPIHVIPYWANQKIWKKTGDKHELRVKHGLPVDSCLYGSFQRDTEGKDLKSPKLEKGPDLFVDYIEKRWSVWHNTDLRFAGEPKKPHVVLAGWRRQYVINRLKNAGIPHSYFELPSQDVVNELYQTLDEYPITSRHEGGPQSLIECGLLDVPVVSRHVGMAEDVLPVEAINDDIMLASRRVPMIDGLKLPKGYAPYRDLIENL